MSRRPPYVLHGSRAAVTARRRQSIREKKECGGGGFFTRASRVLPPHYNRTKS